MYRIKMEKLLLNGGNKKYRSHVDTTSAERCPYQTCKHIHLRNRDKNVPLDQIMTRTVLLKPKFYTWILSSIYIQKIQTPTMDWDKHLAKQPDRIQQNFADLSQNFHNINKNYHIILKWNLSWIPKKWAHVNCRPLHSSFLSKNYLKPFTSSKAWAIFHFADRNELISLTHIVRYFYLRK